MAKRITTDAKIVLERAGYSVNYVVGSYNRIIALSVSNSKENWQLPVNDGCWIDNDLIEELLNMDA